MGASESKVAPVAPAAPAAAEQKKGKEDGVKIAKAANAAAKESEAKETKIEQPNHYELAIKSCKELEFILETEFGSNGNSLHEMITNANASLPIELIMNMRYVATIGNNLIHEKSFSQIPDQEEFVKRYQRSVKALKEISLQRRVVEKRVLQAKRKKREAEIQEELMNEDKEWLEEQHKLITAQKARRLEKEKQKAKELEEEKVKASKGFCSCF
jgi:hypothetical protein